MDSVSKEVTKIMNQTDPIYIDVVVSNEITPNYYSLENLWKYYFGRRNKQLPIDTAMDAYLVKFPTLCNLFQAHCACPEKHLFLMYCYSEGEYLMMRYKNNNTYHFLKITSPPLVKICQGLVEKDPQKVAIIIWVQS